MKRFLAAVTMALVAFGAVPAAATGEVPPLDQIPFSVPVSTGGTSLDTPGAAENTGFIGVCDVELGCVGASTAVSLSRGNATVTPATVIVSGVVCIGSERAPCGAYNDPMTGVVFTQRDYDLPEGELTRPKLIWQTCAWEFDPRFEPGVCTDDITRPIVVDDDLIGTVTLELPEDNLARFEAAVPNSILIRHPVLK